MLQTIFLQNDFVFLSETQSRGKWQFRLIPQYHIFRKDREVGKAGGIAWLVRKEFLDITQQLDIGIKGTLALQVKTGDRTLFLVGVYFPPSGATSREALFERSDIEDKMPALLKQFSDRGEVMLVSDTNARVGNLNDGKVIFDEELTMRWTQPGWPR